MNVDNPFAAPNTSLSSAKEIELNDPAIAGATLFFASTQKLLGWVIIYYLVGGLVGGLLATGGDLSGPALIGIVVFCVFFAGLQAGFWALSKKWPLAATVATLVLFSTMVLLDLLAGGSAAITGLIIKFAILSGLVRGIPRAKKLSAARKRAGL